MSTKQAVLARMARVPANLAVLKPALDKLSEAELVALNHVFLHLEAERAKLKRKIHRGF